MILVGSVCGRLSSFFIFPVHGHALTGEDMCQSTLVAEFAVSFHKPGADLFLLAWFKNIMGEGAGSTRSAGSDLEKFAGYMGEVLGLNGDKRGHSECRNGYTWETHFYRWVISVWKTCLLYPCPFPCPLWWTREMNRLACCQRRASGYFLETIW